MITEKGQISFTEIDSIPQLIKDFLNGKLTDFSDQLFSLDNFSKAISAKQKSYDFEKREILFNVLSNQYQDVELSSKQHENLELLKDKNTFTIITGHQLNLFSGPVFFIYKILQTIKTAEFVQSNFPDYSIVPIFWMASEDHDFEEINHFRTENHFYEIEANSGGAVGRISIEDQFFLHEFEKEFKDSIYGTELIRWMKEAYSQGKTLTQATRLLVQRLFSDFGLLCIDGDEASLKKQMISTFGEELKSNALLNFSKSKVEFLQKEYHKVQVNPRDINLFYLTETRNRIDFNGKNYFVVDTDFVFTKEELCSELQNYPEKFSPNALMRPVFQETVLPNLAYSGGNAEIMYWMELKDYFDHLELPFPLLIPRNSMLFLNEKTLKKIEKLDLKIPDFFKNFADLVQEQLVENHILTQLIENKKQEILLIFNDLKSQASVTDVTFKNLVLAEETRQLKSYEKMHKRLLRAEKIKQGEKLERLENLFYTVHPGKTWQERALNFSVFYGDHGRDWLQSCYDKMDVEKSALIIMQI